MIGETNDDEEGRTTFNNKVTKSTSKVSKSCDHCKLKKIKCDQTRPSCQNCNKFGEQCIYSIMKKPGLKTGYGQQVLDQISELTKLFESSKKQQQLENENLKQSIKFMENKLNGYERGSTSSEVSTINVPPSAVNSTSLEMNQMNLTQPMINDLSMNVEVFDDIPPPEKCVLLIDHYFKYVNPFSPIIHPRQRTAIISDISSNNAVLLGILSIAVKLVAGYDGYFESIKKLIITKCYSVKSTEELTAITLLALALYGELNNHETWSMVSLAIGGVIHLGLGDVSGEENNWREWIDSETKRNLVWEVYKLDKLSSMGSHFNSQMATPKCLLPLDTQYWLNLSTGFQHQTRTLTYRPELNWYGTNSLIIEILQLMDECSSFRRSPLDIHEVKDLLSWQLQCYEFDHKIITWKNQLSPKMSEFLDSDNNYNDIINDPLAVLLHALYNTLLIRLHSPAAFSNSLDKYVSSQTSKSRCLKAAGRILSLLKLPHEDLGPYYPFAIWVSGRVLLVNHISNREDISQDFEYCINLLRSMGYGCAARYADILEYFKDDKVIDSPEFHDHPSTGSYSEEARLIIDLKLNASSLDSLLSRKVERVRNKDNGLDDDVFDWFRLPLET